MTIGRSVIRLAPSHLGSAAELLAAAFQNDPMYRFAVPDDGRRSRDLRWLFHRVARYSLLYGEAYTTPEVEGVCCWLPPGDTDLKIGRLIRAGFLGTVVRFGWAAYRRFDRNMNYSEKLHKQFASMPHWYLWAIAVDGSCRRQGIGTALMQPVMAPATAAGAPCYLETHQERNVRFYESNGYHVVQKGTVPGYGLRVWAMLREP
jgi:ribosomal protein S18 acetylase RimI-like enzyme